MRLHAVQVADISPSLPTSPHLFPSLPISPHLSPYLRLHAVQVAATLRAAGYAVDVLLANKRADKAFSYADRVSGRRMVFVAPDEWDKGSVRVKVRDSPRCDWAKGRASPGPPPRAVRDDPDDPRRPEIRTSASSGPRKRSWRTAASSCRWRS